MLNPKEDFQHVKILNELFNYLNCNTNYVVLRNYEKLPYEYGNDIDILIEKKNIELTLEQLIKIAINHGATIKKIIYKYNYNGVYLQLEDRVLLIDFFTDIVKRWFKYADIDMILKNKIAYNSFFIPLIEHEIAIVVVKEILTYKIVRKKYYNFLIKNRHLDQEIFSSLLDKYFDKASIDNIWKSIIEKKSCRKNLVLTPTWKNYFRPIECTKWLIQRL